MGKKNLFPNGPVATFEENTKKVIENGKKGSTDGGAASKSYVIMQSDEEGRKRENNFSASTQKSTGFAFKPFEPWTPKGGFGSLHREDTDVSVPLVLADGKRYGNVTKTAFEAIRSGNISSYVPVNMEEQVTLSRFVTSPVISLETESGKNFGRVSIAAYDAIVNGGLDKYASHNDEEKETLRKYNAYLSGKVASNVKTLSSEVKKLNDIYETAKGYRSEAHIARNMAATWKSRSNGLTADLDYSVKAKEAEKKLREYLKSVGYESIEDIAKALDEKNTELKHAEIAKKGEKLSAVADPLSQEYDFDFNKKSKYNPEKIPLITIGNGKRIYEYINAEGADKAKYAYENEYAVYDEMTSREKALYNYYYNQLGSDKASEYLSTIEEALHRRAAQKKFDKIKGNRWEELLQVPYLGTNQAVTGIKNAFNAKDEYIPHNQGQILSGMINEDIPDDTAWQVAFDLGSTTFNMVPSIAAGIIHPAAGAVMMGVSSAGNTYQDKLNSGMDKGKARVYSSIVGFSEAGLSYLLGGISKLGGKLTNNALNKMVLGIDNAAARFAFTYGGKVASEAFEESLQTVLEPFFENLVLGYMKNKDIDWGEVVYSGLLGALSAGILEAPGVYSQTFGANSKAKQMGADIRSAGGISEVMDIALSSPAESDARRLSVLYKDRGITGDNISDLQVGRLHQLSKENVREVLESKKSTADEKIKAVAMLGKLNELSGVQDEVYYSKESNDSENKSIIQQLREKISDIMLSPVVADIRFDTDSEKTVPEMKAEIVQTLASRGKETDVSVERKGFGTVDLSYKKLKDGVKYLHYPEEIYSLPYVAEVVKNGIQVYYEKNHKTTGNESFTFAAPVNINGKTYAMGVVVHRSGTTGGNKYHVHRVILPDGSSLVLNKKKQRLESGSVFQENEKPVSPITAVSNAIISQDGGKNNKNMKKVYPGLTAADVEMGNIPENLRVRLENYKKVMAQIGYTVIYKPNRSVPKGTIGYADITNREVYLYPEYLSEALLAHELTHVIDKGYGGKYIKSLVSFFKKNLREDWDKAEARVRETYRDIPGANIEAETLADMCTKFTTDEYIKKAASMEVGTIKQIAVFCKYVGAKLNSIFLDKSNAQKFKVASLKWQMALYKATKAGVNDSGKGILFSVREIKGDSGTSYGIGVFLDSNLLTGLTEDERKQMVKEYVVSELNGESFIAYDGQGTPIGIRIAKKDEYFKNEKGNRRQVIKEIYSKYNGNKVKQEAIVLVDELISAAEFDKKTPAKHKHDWLDDNGKNDWDVWEVYIQEKNKAVWKATLNVANTQNGEKILYDIGPIKMVEQAGKSATSTTNYSISDVGENVNKNLLTNDDILLSYAGPKAETANDSLYRRAVNMDKKGATPNEIWAKTGWYRGQDGKWRFEIDDSRAVFSPRGMFRAGGVKEGTLPAYLRHNKLYKAYPFLRDVKVKIDNNLPMNEHGSYSNGTKTITINGKLSPETQLSSALHEAQHAIQRYEGFAKGASTDFWEKHPVYYPEREESVRKKVKSAEDKFRQLPNGEYYLKLAEEYFESDLPSYYNKETEERLNEIKGVIEKAGIGDIFEEYNDARYELFGAMHRARPHSYQLYQNTAGEIESRDVQKRQSLSKEQRRENFPESFKEHPDTVFVEDYEEDTVANEYNESSEEADVVGEIADTSALEEEISIIDEALKDKSLPRDDRVALIKEKVRLQRQLSGGRDVHGEEDTPRTKGLEGAVEAYRESGDASGIPTRQSVAASKKYYEAKISDIEAEMKQVYEVLSNKEYLSDMEYDELCNRYDALRTQWREAAKKNSVLAEVSDIHDEIDTAARPNHTWVRDIAGWLSDKKNLIKYGTYNLDDIERNFKIFFGEHFKKAYDKIIQPLYDSKKAYVFGVTEYANKLKREIVDGLGIKKGSKMSAAVQWLGEGQKPVSKKAGAELAPYTYKDCVDEFGADAAKKIQKATEIFREMYDELLDQVNETRAMLYPNNPDKLIPKREDYFRHFQEMSQGFEGLKNILQTNIGIDPMLVGVSENTKPKSKWQSFAQSRMGNSTTYDAVGGFLDYLPAAQYSIHIDPNIVNVRSLAYDLASAKAAENGGNGNPNTNGFIAYLQRYANSLAGKTTSHFDRAIQDSSFGRTAMAVVSWLNNKTKASAVLGNINSVLSQVTNIKNVIGKIEHQSDVVRGAMEALAGINPNSEIAARYDDSGFLKERYLDKVFSQFDTGWDKVNPVKWAADLLGFADEIGTRITWNAAYNEAVRKNIKNPVQYADNFTRASVAGRGIGEEALVFKSQVAKMFLPFRTEVLNDLRVQQDILFGKEYDIWEKNTDNSTDKGNDDSLVKKIKGVMDRIRKMPEIFNVTEDVLEHYSIYENQSEQIYKYFESIGGSVEHPVLGKIDLHRKGARSTIMHGFGKRKLLAVGAIKDVLEKGEIIDFQENWDGKGFDTYVVVGRGNMTEGRRLVPCAVGVIVKSYPKNNIDNKFYVHEVVEIKNEKGSPSATAANNDATRRGNPSLEMIISQDEGKSNKKVSTELDRFDEIIAMGKKVDTSTVKRVKNIMQLYVASMVVNAVLAAIKSDEFDPLDEAKEGYEEDGVLGALVSVMEDYANGVGDPVAFDPIYDIASGIYQGVNEGASAGGKVGQSVQRTVQNLAGDLVSNNPFSTAVMGAMGFDSDVTDMLFNGNMYMPGGMGMPLAGNVLTMLRELGQGDYASAAAATVKPFLPLGTQIDRSIKGIYDYTKGYATNEAAYERMTGQEGNLKYLIEPGWRNLIKSALFGPGAYARESSTYKLNEDQTNEVLKEKDYQSRKTLFDEIIEWKQYDDGREDILEKRALEYYGEDEDSVLGKLLRYTDDKGKEKRRDNVVPYGRFKQGISITLDDRKFNGIISVEKAEEMNAIMGERLEYWYDMLNESAEFSRLDDERKESIVNSIYNIESDHMVVQELYRQGVVPDYEYNNYGYDYVIKCAEKMSEIDASVMRQYADDALEEYVIDRDNAEKFAEYNAANTAAMFIKNAYFMDDDIKSEVQRYYQTESTREPDAVDKEIARLTYENRSKMYVYGNPSSIISYTKNGVKYALQVPAEDIYGIFESADTQVRRNLEKLMKDKDYINASDKDKKEMVESVRDSVRSKLRKRYKAMYPPVKVEDAYDRTIDDSVDDKISEYYDENSDKDDIDAEVERVGKSTKDRIKLQADADDIFVFTDKSFEYSIQVPSDDVYGIFSDYNTQVRSGLSSLFKESRYIDASDIVKRKMIVSTRDQVRKRIRDSIKNMYPSIKVRTLFDRIINMK